MPLLISLAALHNGTVHLEGELTPDELQLETLDPCIEARSPIRYSLKADIVGKELLVEGSLETTFHCRCVRCLKPFEYELSIDPWTSLVELEGEDAAPIVHESVDLTPQVREDSFLALPQHPVCNPECQGMPLQPATPKQSQDLSDESRQVPSAWSILDTLKLD